MDDPHLPLGIDVTALSPARVYDYTLGGKDNFPVDRQAADYFMSVFPDSRESARANRAFLGRAVRYCAELGIRQFLDIGSGLPTVDNVHQVAQRIDPQARTVYVDNDALTHNHAVALLDGDPYAAFIRGDVREPDEILTSPVVRQMIDFSEPVAYLFVALLHFVGEGHDPARLVRALTRGAVPGSAVVASHLTLEDMPPEMVDLVAEVYGSGTAPLTPRSRAFIETLFPWPLTEDGLKKVQHWQAGDAAPIYSLNLLGGVAVKGR